MTGNAVTDNLSNSENTVQLADGRRIGLSEYGNSNGQPIFYFHGFPGSRLEISHYDQAARNNDCRIIALDRPGMGLSSIAADRTILSWVSDVKSVAKTLELNKFSVFGHSGGAPFVAACAHEIPERLYSAAIVSGMAPLDEPTVKNSMTMDQRIVNRIIQVIPSMTKFMMFITKRILSNPGKVLKRLPDIDQEIFKDSSSKSTIINSIQEAFRNGTAGSAQEMRLLFKSWGFDLRNIKFPIVIWQGTKDIQVPVSHAQIYKDLVPGSTLHLIEGHGHHSLIRNYSSEILIGLRNQG